MLGQARKDTRGYARQAKISKAKARQDFARNESYGKVKRGKMKDRKVNLRDKEGEADKRKATFGKIKASNEENRMKGSSKAIAYKLCSNESARHRDDETDRQTDKQTNKQKDTQTNRHRQVTSAVDTYKCRYIER